MKNKSIIRKVVIILIMLLLFGCAETNTTVINKPSIEKHSHSMLDARYIIDSWWMRLFNEDPDFYSKINLSDNIIVHLCGSREVLSRINKNYKLDESTYMYTSHNQKTGLIEFGLIVKVINNRVYPHPLAYGHEFIHALKLHQKDMVGPHEIFKD